MHDAGVLERVQRRLISQEAELDGLEGAWRRLWQACPCATPFQSAAWLIAWWRVFGTGEPRIATLWRDESLIGLLPLYRLTERGEGKLLPMGAGLSDYHDALVHPTAPADAAAGLLDTALAHADGVAGCDLPELAPDSRLRAAAVPPGWSDRSWAGEPCPLLTLRGDLRDSVPGHMLRKWRLAEHRAERLGVAVEASAAGDLPTTRLYWRRLVELHRARWTSRGEPCGGLADPRVIAFHELAIPGLLEAGLLRLHALRFGSSIVAVVYALAAGGRLFLYLTGFDAAHAFESPGTILLGRLLQSAVEEGRRELHFLRGGEGYKFAWGGDARRNLGRSFRRDDWRS
jgi:CelD/BcsL family acetyltransferase involved in cellulose biosynthesis